MSGIDDKDIVRRKVIGLGEDSLSKSYYPQLQQKVKELQEQKEALELKTSELTEAIRKMKETKALLRESEHKFRVLFESANDAIFIFDRSNKCIDGNAKAVELLKIEEKEQLIGVVPYELPPVIQPSGLESVKLGPHLMEKAWNGESQVFEWLFHLSDDSKVYCEVSLSQITIDNKQFLQAIVRDISDFKKLENDIRLASIRSEERERLRFAKELHDGIGPILSTVKLYVQWLDESENEEHIKIIKKKITESITEATVSLKEVSRNLSPHVLINYGLIEALQAFVDRILETGKININLEHNFKERLNSDLEAMFYRVVTELINNTIKHAEAGNINIQFKEENDIIKFSYFDDGKGFQLGQLNEKGQSMGLDNIRNRVKSVGGAVEFLNTEKGVQVNIVIVRSLY